MCIRDRYENLQKNYGIVVKTSREQIYARAASPDLADKLDISEGPVDSRTTSTPSFFQGRLAGSRSTVMRIL